MTVMVDKYERDSGWLCSPATLLHTLHRSPAVKNTALPHPASRKPDYVPTHKQSSSLFVYSQSPAQALKPHIAFAFRIPHSAVHPQQPPPSHINPRVALALLCPACPASIVIHRVIAIPCLSCASCFGLPRLHRYGLNSYRLGLAPRFLPRHAYACTSNTQGPTLPPAC